MNSVQRGIHHSLPPRTMRHASIVGSVQGSPWWACPVMGCEQWTTMAVAAASSAHDLHNPSTVSTLNVGIQMPLPKETQARILHGSPGEKGCWGKQGLPCQESNIFLEFLAMPSPHGTKAWSRWAQPAKIPAVNIVEDEHNGFNVALHPPNR